MTAALVDYHGAFIPQIPEQLIRRFTKEGDLVIDPMCGSGTSLAVARSLGRDAVGCDISSAAVRAIRRTVVRPAAVGPGRARVVLGDMCEQRTLKAMHAQARDLGHHSASLVILHPPYFNIIRFSQMTGDLSQIDDVDDFLTKVSEVFQKTLKLVQNGGVIAVVIGDIYLRGAWYPLAFRVLDRLLSAESNVSLRGIVIKNMDNSRGKRKSGNLWRYRSLQNQTFVFSHEYILVFRTSA
jgi:DNA modification methylase